MAQDNIESLPFEAAMKELEEIVGKLEKSGVALEESITLYERGEQLKKHCEKLLKSAEMRVDKIMLDARGQVAGATPLDP